MAGSVNKAIIVGNLGRDPEFKDGKKGQFCKFSIATSEWTPEGENDRTEWHNIVCFNEGAVKFAKYLTKGQKVYVEGSLRTSKYDNKDGVAMKSTDIIASKIEGLSSKSEMNAQGNSSQGVSLDDTFPSDSPNWDI